MFEIRVTVDIPQLNDIAAMMAGQTAMPGVFAKPETEKPKSARSKKTEEPKIAVDPAAEEVSPEEPAVAQDAPVVASNYTVEELRAKAAALAKEGKREAVKKILTGMGYESISSLPETDYDIFMEKAGAL